MNKDWGILLGVLGIGLIIFLVTRKTSPIDAQAGYSTNRLAVKSNQLTVQNNYDNEEVREIEYNNDGLPTRITIHRHASVA